MLIFQHGNYSVDPDTGYMELTPFQQDGRMQLSRPCENGQDTVQYYAQCVLRRAREIADRLQERGHEGIRHHQENPHGPVVLHLSLIHI